MKIGVLGNPEGWYVRDLRRASRGEQIEVLSFASLSVALRPTGINVQAMVAPSGTEHFQANRGQDVSLNRRADGYDALLVRTMPWGSLEQIIFRMNALHALERQGQRIFNPPRCLEIAIDKWLTLEFLQHGGMEVPSTIACQTRPQALEAFELLGRNCVVKPLFGGEGNGLMHVTDIDLAWRVFGAIEQIGGVFYLQEFLEHDGYDLRLLVIGDEIFAVKRYARGDWRTNVSQGGEAVPHEPSAKEMELAKRAAHMLGGAFLGVDLVPTRDGRLLLLEANAVPGWRGTAAALQVDIARRVIDHLVSQVQG